MPSRTGTRSPPTLPDPVGSLGAFTYSPPVALVSYLAGGLPFWVFLWLWLAVLVATAIWLGGRRALLVLAFPPVAMELYHANVHLLIAAAIVLGFRHPWTWSVVLLTKPTAGVGLLWFAARREWRSLAIALGFTAVIVGISLVVAPRMWLDWVEYLFANASAAPGGFWVPVPLWIRVPWQRHSSSGVPGPIASGPCRWPRPSRSRCSGSRASPCWSRSSGCLPSRAARQPHPDEVGRPALPRPAAS